MVLPIDKRRDALDIIYKRLFNKSYYSFELSYNKLIYSELLEKYKNNDLFNGWRENSYEKDDIQSAISCLFECFGDNDDIMKRKEIIIMMNPYIDTYDDNDFAHIILQLYLEHGSVNFNSYMEIIADYSESNNDRMKKILDIVDIECSARLWLVLYFEKALEADFPIWESLFHSFPAKSISLSFDEVDNTYCWRDLNLENIPDCLARQIECLDLGHDGLIGLIDNPKYGNIIHDSYDDVKKAISLFPNLHIISYCGYYSSFDKDDFKKIFTELGRDPNRLICHSNT